MGVPRRRGKSIPRSVLRDYYGKSKGLQVVEKVLFVYRCPLFVGLVVSKWTHVETKERLVFDKLLINRKIRKFV